MNQERIDIYFNFLERGSIPISDAHQKELKVMDDACLMEKRKDGCWYLTDKGLKESNQLFRGDKGV